MFDHLVESNPKNRRQGWRGAVSSTLLSVVFHTGIITAAVFATMGVVHESQEVNMDTIMLTFDEPEPDQPDEPPPPVITSLNPPPKGFQVLSAPVDIPREIPPIDLNQRFDPRDYSGVGVEGGVFSGVEGGTGPVDLTQVFAEAVVDEVPDRISCPVPDYPRMMQQANIEGQVLLQFVVDTTGHVETPSIKTQHASHRAFEGPAKDMIAKCLFRPGRVRGRPVRVLVQMPINFTLQR